MGSHAAGVAIVVARWYPANIQDPLPMSERNDSAGCSGSGVGGGRGDDANVVITMVRVGLHPHTNPHTRAHRHRLYRTSSSPVPKPPLRSPTWNSLLDSFSMSEPLNELEAAMLCLPPWALSSGKVDMVVQSMRLRQGGEGGRSGWSGSERGNQIRGACLQNGGLHAGACARRCRRDAPPVHPPIPHTKRLPATAAPT